MDLGIAGKTALITGGSGDIGFAVAGLLRAENVRIILTDIKEDRLREKAASLGDDVQAVAADLSSQQGVEALRGDVDGEVDILVHAAGVTGAKGDPLEIDEDDWNHALQTDLMSAVRVSKAFIPAMADRGWGRAVYVTSENASQSYPDEVVYNVAKAGVLAFAKGVSMPYAKKGVLVNCVAPAFIKTNMTDQMMDQRAEQMGVSRERAVETFLDQERPYLVLGRRGKPDEVAAAIAFLVSERASFVVGANYRVDGGAVVGLDT